MAAREMGGLSLADALSLCELLAKTDPVNKAIGTTTRKNRAIEGAIPSKTWEALKTVLNAGWYLQPPGHIVSVP